MGYGCFWDLFAALAQCLDCDVEIDGIPGGTAHNAPQIFSKEARDFSEEATEESSEKVIKVALPFGLFPSWPWKVLFFRAKGGNLSFYPWSCSFARPWFCSRLSVREMETRRIFEFLARQLP